MTERKLWVVELFRGTFEGREVWEPRESRQRQGEAESYRDAYAAAGWDVRLCLYVPAEEKGK